MYVRLTASQAGEKESEEGRLEGDDLDVEGQEDDEEEHAKATTTMTAGGAAASTMGGLRGGDRAAAAMGGSGGFPGGELLARTVQLHTLYLAGGSVCAIDGCDHVSQRVDACGREPAHNRDCSSRATLVRHGFFALLTTPDSTPRNSE